MVARKKNIFVKNVFNNSMIFSGLIGSTGKSKSINHEIWSIPFAMDVFEVRAVGSLRRLMLMGSAYAGKSKKPAKALAASEQQTAAGQPALGVWRSCRSVGKDEPVVEPNLSRRREILNSSPTRS